MERCQLKEQVDMEIKEQYQFKISNRRRVTEDFKANVAIDWG